MENIQDLMNKVFGVDMDFGIYGDMTKNYVDEKELSKTGVVTKTVSESNGIVTETFEYESFDKSDKFSKTLSYNKNEEVEFKLVGLEEQIYQAIKTEDYAKAAQLKKEKEDLLNIKKA